MAVLDVARGREVCRPQSTSAANRATGDRQPRRLRSAVEIGGTLVALMLIAVSVLALRFILVLAHGVAQ
ncbi:MAG TPA: hypothetical protein VII07_15490 [Bradyrhizobium sp.]